MHSKNHPRSSATAAATKAIATALIAVFTLAACGGFAGSSSDTTGSGNGVDVPDNLISDSATGTRDSFYRDGNIKDFSTTTYRDGVSYGHRRIEGPRNDPSLHVPLPPQDVRDAWTYGWTGQGVNLLVMDTFGGGLPVPAPGSTNGTHGYTVSMSVLEVAPRVRLIYTEAGLREEGGGTNRGLHENYNPPTPDAPGGGGVPRSTPIKVINMSFGTRPGRSYAGSGELTVFYAEPYNRQLYADLTGRPNPLFMVEPHIQNADDSVITKAAGNDGGVDAALYIDNFALIDNRYTATRTIIVGALDKYARASTTGENSNVSRTARMAEYSAHAGGHGGMQNRFLVEYGGTPYGERAYLCDRYTRPVNSEDEIVRPVDGCNNPQIVDDRDPFRALAGTSFAAPRVAGFAALVRDKFPGLSGAQTAEILLDTATTEGLACHTGNSRKSPACPRAIYGQGRVSIDDALSPMGKLD